MEIRIQRLPADGECLPGECFVNGIRHSYSLERTSLRIHAGRFRVRFTVSERAERGELWTPDPEFRLPLIVVPGRSGIRLHAANEWGQLQGCIALGQTFANDRLGSSRAAVAPIVADIRAAAARGEEIWIDVRDPQTPSTETRSA